jgi:glycosyltransferase involved in cell wall biosynthesis
MAERRARGSVRTLLILSQVYVPDPASVGQHMHDAAAQMVRRGWRVVVYTSARGYEDPSRRYPSREIRDGVDIRRLPLSSLGKSSIAIRLLGSLLFLAQAILRGLFVRNVSAILVSTSPPMCSIAGALLGRFKRAPVDYWAMDINPDQMIALGKMAPDSWAARFTDRPNVWILKRARHVIALDRYMAARLDHKFPIQDKLAVMPPWPHLEDVEQPIAHAANPFRAAHGLEDKFVFMYSGNLSPSHPITTVLEASLRLREHANIVFMFIGGGAGRREVEAFVAAHHPTNIKLLPYQPLDQIRYSLSAADVHIVSMGESMVGVVHPCKVYGALAVGRPILLLGPESCHVSDILSLGHVGWRIPHGDVAGAASALLQIAETPVETLRHMGQRALEQASDRFSRKVLLGRFCDTLEAAD